MKPVKIKAIRLKNLNEKIKILNEEIDSLKTYKQKYQDQRETEFEQLKEDVKSLKAKQTENEYRGKHSSMQLLGSDID